MEEYPPVERPGHELGEDQATVANTDNLKEKMRTTPQDDGTYTIPDGLFVPSAMSRAFEIFLLGLFIKGYRFGIITNY